jgi:hypothetical protein
MMEHMTPSSLQKQSSLVFLDASQWSRSFIGIFSLASKISLSHAN